MSGAGARPAPLDRRRKLATASKLTVNGHLPHSIAEGRCMRLAVRRAAILAASLGVLVAGCGSDGDGASASASEIPACAEVDETISRPSELSEGFPLPPGTVFTATRESGSELQISAVIPDDFRSVVKFFSDELPASGYELGEGDAEQDEAEAPFTGNGTRGEWKINGIIGCQDAVRLTLGIEQE
jgi:hypothetical protein